MKRLRFSINNYENPGTLQLRKVGAWHIFIDGNTKSVLHISNHVNNGDKEGEDIVIRGDNNSFEDYKKWRYEKS